MSEDNREVIAKARVEVLLEINLDSTWDSTCNIERVFKQASDDAKDIVRRAFEKTPNIRLVGEPIVNPIIASEKR